MTLEEEKRLYDRRRRRKQCVGCGVPVAVPNRCAACREAHVKRMGMLRERKPWTREEVALAARLWRKGGKGTRLERLRRIADKLGRSAATVQSKLRREDGILPPEIGTVERCGCGLMKDEDHKTCDMGPITSYMRQQDGAWPTPPP